MRFVPAQTADGNEAKRKDVQLFPLLTKVLATAQ